MVRETEEIWPQFAARNLYEFLEDESFGIEAMNQALKPQLAGTLASGGNEGIIWFVASRSGIPPGAPLLGTLGARRFRSVFEGGFVLSFRDGSERDCIRAGEPAGRSPCE